MKTNNKDKYFDIPKNYQNFVLVQKTNAKPEDYGYTEEAVLSVLDLVKNDPNNYDLEDDDLQNDLGCFFNDGVCVERNVEFAKYWFAKSADQGNDLARSNLADIYRKGTDGTEVDLKKAFELYKACGLPYPHYRCGEFYEKGWGVDKNIEEAKRYYSLAYSEGHPLAKKKLKDWNFLED